MTALSVQVGGDHYRNLKIQPIEYIIANELRFCEGSVVKYVTRWRDKGGVADLMKARHILDILIESENSERNPERGSDDSKEDYDCRRDKDDHG